MPRCSGVACRMAATMQTTVYDLDSDALKSCWNSLAAALEQMYSGRSVGLVDHALKKQNPGSRGFSLGGSHEYRNVFINRQDPMVSILYAASKPKPLDKLVASEILASVPFSRVHDRETGNVLILPMGLQKWPLAWGLSPEGTHVTEPTPYVLTRLFEEIHTQFPKSVIFTRFAGDHIKETGAIRLWSRMFPHRFCVGWASYDGGLRREIVYPEKLQLEQDLEAAYDAFLAAEKDYEEARRQYKEQKSSDLAKQRKKAAKQRMRDRQRDHDELDDLVDAFDPSTAVERIDEVRDVARPVEPDPVPQKLRAPTGSGISYENDTLTIRAGLTPLVRIEHASKIPPVKMLLGPEHSDTTGTVFVAWYKDAEPGAQAGFMDVCV